MSTIESKSSNKRNNPVAVDHFGLTTFYRPEYYDDKLKIIEVSIRSKSLNNSKSHAKFGKILLKSDVYPGKELPRDDELPHEVVVATIEKALYDHGMFADLCVQMPELLNAKCQLGLIAPYALRELQKVHNYTPDHFRNLERAMKRMVDLWGTLEIADVVPARCSQDLLNVSRSMMNNILALLRQMWTGILANVVEDPQIWSKHHMHGRRIGYNAERLNTNIENNRGLSDLQCAEIASFAVCNAVKNRRALAALMMMLLPITPEELLALRLEDIFPNPEFPGRFIINVQFVLQPSTTVKRNLRVRRRHNKLRKITVRYKKRYLPAGALLSTILRQIKDCGSDEEYLFPNPKNKKRFDDPAELMAWIKSTFPGLNRNRLMNTAIGNLNTFKLRDEELRYLRGLPPKHTDARYYVSFKDHSLQNSVSIIQDVWLSLIGLYTPESIQGYSQQIDSPAYRIARGITRIPFPIPLSEKNAVFIILSALGGINAHITYRRNAHEQ